MITCACLTRDRRQWLPQAIACYQAQTYSTRELVIVADGEDVTDLVPTDDSSIRLLRVPEGMSIAAKRNLAAEVARGAWIAHWDDDDYSAPGRLADQAELMIRTDAAVVGYVRLRFTDGEVWWRYRRGDHAHGTSLLYRRDWWAEHRFNTRMARGEDVAFVWAARNAARLAQVDARDLMYARIHEGNARWYSMTSVRDWERVA